MTDDKKLHIQWYPGHMAKSAKGVAEDMALVDAVVEVLDARIPASSHNQYLERVLKGKPLIPVLNKRDLADEKATGLWIKYYRSLGFRAVAVNAARKQSMDALLAAVNSAVEPLMRKLETKGRLRRPVRAMIVGVPNTGKSTVINAIAPSKAAATGNKPGITRGRQWIRTAGAIEMLDTPGVLWPRLTDETAALRLAICGTIKDQALPLDDIALALARFLLSSGKDGLRERFGIGEGGLDANGLSENDLSENGLLEAIGRKRGLLGPGGEIRLSEAGILLLKEFRAGLLGRFTLDDIPEGGA